MAWFDVTHLLRGLVLLWFGVVGACVGSFLNVVVYRLPAGLNLWRPGSRCPFCTAAIVAKDNIPILSWFVLRGRCRHCHLPIATRYPWVEFSVAALFVLLSAVWLPPHSFYYHVDDKIVDQWLGLCACLALMCTWIAAALIEKDGRRVPLRLVIPLSVVAGVPAVNSAWHWGLSADGGARTALSSLGGGMAAGVLAALVTGPSALVSGVTWAVLLMATGSLFGLNGFVAIWFVATCGRLVSAVCRPPVDSLARQGESGDSVVADCRQATRRGCWQRVTDGLAGWTVATLGWSVACGAASAGRGEAGHFSRLASPLATSDWTWVLALGGSIVLVSLLTGRVRAGQSQA